MTQNVKKWRQSARFGGAFYGVLLLLSVGLLASAGCSSDCSGDDCQQCEDRDCADGQRCVQKECRSACSDDAACEAGQVCATYEFREGDRGRYCVVVPGSKPVGTGRFTACEDSSECDEAHGFSCVESECNYECQSHSDCVAVGHCDVKVVDGTSRRLCVRHEEPPTPGELYTNCPNGDECSEPSLCIGAGAGDLDAYCSIDCQDDGDCGFGYSCGSVTRAPCADACDLEGRPSDPRCAPVEQIGDGLPYGCGLRGPERRVCLKREFCAPCESDADCLGMPNQVCARDQSGEKICTQLCDTERRSCPWGNAARCAVFDEELGLATCSHRFGSCHGSGLTCEPCRDDGDCPDGVCAASQFTGERWCIDLTARCACENGVGSSGTCFDGGCPDSPSGLPVMCVGEPSSSLFNLCYAGNAAGSSAIGQSSPQTGCWGPN